MDQVSVTAIELALRAAIGGVDALPVPDLHLIIASYIAPFVSSTLVPPFADAFGKGVVDALCRMVTR